MANWLDRLVTGVRQGIEHLVETVTGRARPEPITRDNVQVPDDIPDIEIHRQLIEPEPETDFEEDTGEGAMDFERFFEEEEPGTETDDLDAEYIDEGPDTRGPFATRAEAEAYADEIPVPTEIGRTHYGLWIVKVIYP